jgi:hypothetical protein
LHLLAFVYGVVNDTKSGVAISRAEFYLSFFEVTHGLPQTYRCPFYRCTIAGDQNSLRRDWRAPKPDYQKGDRPIFASCPRQIGNKKPE